MGCTHTPGAVLGGAEQGFLAGAGASCLLVSQQMSSTVGSCGSTWGPHCPSEHMATASLPTSKYGTNIASANPILKPFGKGVLGIDTV